MPGGLRASNIGLLKKNTNAFFYHSSAIVNLSETADGVEINAMQNLKL
jgi:copper homeostasis protein CutC